MQVTILLYDTGSRLFTTPKIILKNECHVNAERTTKKCGRPSVILTALKSVSRVLHFIVDALNYILYS